MKLNRDVNNIVEYWCNYWNIKKPVIIIDESDRGNGYHKIGEDDSSIIGINTKITKPYMLKTAMLHELRHHYQFIKYSDFYTWWAENDEIYFKLYNYALCTIEEDANIFSWSNGKYNGDILLNKYDKNFIIKACVDIAKNRNNLIKYHKEIKSFELNNGIFDWIPYKESKVKKEHWDPDYLLIK